MRSLKLAISYGFLVWVIPFVVAILIYPLRSSERPLFESIMPVVLALSVMVFAVLYSKKNEISLREGVLLGILWMIISLVIDFFMFIWGPIKMSISDYIKDIGITYLTIPIITIGYGYVKKIKKED